MVASTTRKKISLVISLLVMVISLTGAAFGATVPTVVTATRYTPEFAGAPGKMVRDTAGNFYVSDFWGKGIVKLNSQGVKVGFIATDGRPTAVAVLSDSTLVVAISKPTPKIAFYSQVTGAEVAVFGVSAQPLFNPVAITVDGSGYIYVLDSGDTGYPSSSPNYGRVRVYSSTGSYLYVFGARTPITTYPDVAADGAFKMPMGIAYEKESTNIVVADTENQRLQFFKNYAADPLCGFVKKLGVNAGRSTNQPIDDNTTVVRFGDPTEIAFEYDATGATLNRIYATERGKGDIVAIDPVSQYSLKRINGSTVAGAAMKYPSGLVFEKTSTGGVLYVSNAAAAQPANIMALSIDSGAVPSQTVTMTMDAVPATTAAASVTVTGTTTPSTNVSCSVNGGAGIAAGSGNWSAVIPLADSVNNYILCKSESGGAYKEAYSYKGTATAAPLIAITQPSTTLATSSLTVTVEGTSDMANTNVRVENGLNSYATTVQTDIDNKWSAVVTLAEGSNLITAIGSKPGTNTSSPVTVTVVADTTPPVLTVSSLGMNATTNEAVQNIDGFVVDANLDTIIVNGENVPTGSLVSVGGNITYFSVPVTLVRGANKITVTAKDLAGNTPAAPYEKTNITLNPEIPGLTVAIPADNSYMKGVSTASASGTVDTSFSTVNITTINPPATTPVVPASGAWSTTTDFAVSDSLSPYMFTATAGTNPDVTVKRTIMNNALYAKLAITYPPADVAINTSSVTITGEVAPGFAPAPQISIDGAPYVAVTLDGSYATNGKFSYAVTSLTEGSHVVKVKADATTAVRNIIRDTVNPQLTVQADTKSMPTIINGSIEPSAKISGITATLSGSPVVPPIPVAAIHFDPYTGSGEVSWYADLSTYTYDAISFSSQDPAGNLSTIAYTRGIPTGDIDGDGVVRLADALAALRHVAGTDVITDAVKLFNGDVGALVDGRAARDGVIDITDSGLILNKAYGLMTF